MSKKCKHEKNILVFTNYIDVTKKWARPKNIASLAKSLPLCKFIIWFKERLTGINKIKE